MNKNIFNMVLLIVAMMANVNEIKCASPEEVLKKYENQVYSKISYFNSLKNMFKLAAYAKTIDPDLMASNNFFSRTNNIDKDHALYNRKEKLVPFFGNDSAKAIENACRTKVHNTFLFISTAAAAAIGYYFYSKNK